MALFRVSKATENETESRVKLISETLMGLYWMLSGLWSCNLKPTRGDGCHWLTLRYKSLGRLTKPTSPYSYEIAAKAL